LHENSDLAARIGQTSAAALQRRREPGLTRLGAATERDT
jgi:hypothetical protein